MKTKDGTGVPKAKWGTKQGNFMKVHPLDREVPKKKRKVFGIFDAEHPDRQKAIKILEKICDRVKNIKGELWYELEDFITLTINDK
jgi:hypothetical protein